MHRDVQFAVGGVAHVVSKLADVRGVEVGIAIGREHVPFGGLHCAYHKAERGGGQGTLTRFRLKPILTGK